MMAKVATHGVKILVVALALVGCFGWLWTHKHKKALHAHLDTTLGHLTSAESDKSELHLARIASLSPQQGHPH
jgi:hypothetical protein